MTSTVRAAALTHYEETARQVGLDPYEMLRSVGISQSALHEKDMRIEVTAVRELLERSAAVSGVENFGLRMAQSRRLSILGSLGLAVRDAPNLHTVLRTTIDFMRMHNESLLMQMESADGFTCIRADLLLPASAGIRQSVELSMGALLRIMKIYLGEDWSPVRVSFVHQSPVDLTLHRTLFGPSLEFGAEYDGLICKTADLEQPIATADPVMAAYGKKQLEQGLGPGQSATLREVRQLILLLLPSGRCSVDRVAQHLCKDRRTIHRQLAARGVTFSQLLQETRCALSDRYLQTSHRTLAEIANLLGFSGASAYARWHQHAFAQTVVQRRSWLATVNGGMGLSQ